MHDSTKHPSTIVRLSFSITIGLVIVFGAALLLFFWSFWETHDLHRDRMRFYAQVIAGAAAIYGAFYAGVSLQGNIQRERVHRAFDIVRSQSSIEFIAIFEFLERFVTTTKQQAPIDWRKEIDNNNNGITDKSERSLEQALRHVLSSFEDTAIAVTTGYADERTIYLANGQLMPLCYGLLRSYIEHVRATRRSQGYMRELEKVCDCWVHRKMYYTGSKIPEEDHVPMEIIYGPAAPKKAT